MRHYLHRIARAIGRRILRRLEARMQAGRATRVLLLVQTPPTAGANNDAQTVMRWLELAFPDCCVDVAAATRMLDTTIHDESTDPSVVTRPQRRSYWPFHPMRRFLRRYNAVVLIPNGWRFAQGSSALKPVVNELQRQWQG